MSVAPEAAPGDSATGVALQGGFDLLPHLTQFLQQPAPLTLLVMGGSGTGKSTLLRTLLRRLSGPRLYLAYRTAAAGGSAGSGVQDQQLELSFLLFDPGTDTGPSGDPRTGVGAPDLASGAATPPTGETLPAPFAEAVAQLAGQGGGCVVVDAWDPSAEQASRASDGTPQSAPTFTAPYALLRGQLGRSPVRAVIAIPPTGDSGLVSAADGVIELGWEETEEFRLRVVSIPKLKGTPPPETRYLYSLEGGVFYCPPQFPPGYRPPIGPPHPDPRSEEESLFPGSVPFANAFGRLRYRGLTGLEVPPRFPSHIADLFLYPMAAHTLAIGGRVVWIPSAASGPLQVAGQLARFLPPEFLRERLRVLSPHGTEPGMGELRGVALSALRPLADPQEGPRAPPSTSGPLFPEAFRFLQGTPEGKPSLYVIHLDGLHALATIAKLPLTAETFPMVIGAYAKLPRFHGLGFGRSDDPITKMVAAVVDTHLRLVERYGRNVILGVRPRTNPYILDWTDESGRYNLVPAK